MLLRHELCARGRFPRVRCAPESSDAPPRVACPLWRDDVGSPAPRRRLQGFTEALDALWCWLVGAVARALFFGSIGLQSVHCKHVTSVLLCVAKQSDQTCMYLCIAEQTCAYLCRAGPLTQRKVWSCEWDACGACIGALPPLCLQTCMSVHQTLHCRHNAPIWLHCYTGSLVKLLA